MPSQTQSGADTANGGLVISSTTDRMATNVREDQRTDLVWCRDQLDMVLQFLHQNVVRTSHGIWLQDDKRLDDGAPDLVRSANHGGI